jgi:hypothetical protein
MQYPNSIMGVRKRTQRRRLKRSKGGQYNIALFKKAEEIINSRILEPNIINPDSNFVVVTYWWGRGNINNNFKRPCESDKVTVPKDIRNEYINLLLKEAYLNNPSKYKSNPEKFKQQAIKAADSPEGRQIIADLAAQRYKEIPEVKPIKYEEMMEIWKENCKKANVNYMAVEYPQFAVKGGYQFAINAKPYFIRKALEVCGGRSVVYIDGDMNVLKYPHIFDMKNVDFMARGWNMDPRSKWNYEDAPAVDYYVFETSGGIMFFADTIQAKNLLKLWIAATEHPSMWSKADDRILSWIFNNFRAYLPVNFIQLPIEYLYLSLSYDRYLDKRFHIHKNGRKIQKGPADYDAQIFIDHPQCLTPEETAMEASKAATNRQPEFYNENITERVTGERSGGFMWQYVMYDSPKMKDAMAMYEFYVDTHEHIYTEEYENDDGDIVEEEVPAMYPVPYEDKYGRKLNEIAFNNIKWANRMKLSKFQITNINNSRENYVVVPEYVPGNKVRNPIYAILLYLLQGHNVLYVPMTVNPIYKAAVEEEISYGEAEFIAVNIEPTKKPNNPWELYSEYRPKFAPDGPIYFSAKNRIVLDLVKITRNIGALSRTFKSSILFLTRIRCSWVAIPRKNIIESKNFWTDQVRTGLRPPSPAIVQKIAGRIAKKAGIAATDTIVAAIMNQMGALIVQLLLSASSPAAATEEVVEHMPEYPITIDTLKPILKLSGGPMNIEETPVRPGQNIPKANVALPTLGGRSCTRKRRCC